MFFKKRNKGYEDYAWNETGKSPWLRSTGEFILEIIKVVVISLAIIIPVRFFIIQPFYVKGASMEPNFYDHQYLIINEITYRFQGPQRGDIVVFRYPRDPNQYFIKRIIGLPGEKVEIKDGQVYIYNEQHPQGEALNEDAYLSISAKTFGDELLQIGPNEYFVLGDNRSSSMDSRNFGPISADYLVGYAWLRGWPLDVLKVFRPPDYNL
ncbi:MAG: signal peptidase I [bacterium]